MENKISENKTSHPSLDITIDITDTRWTAAIEGIKNVISHACETAYTMSKAKLNTPSGRPEISILLADDEKIAELNKIYREKNKPTNILSFAHLEDKDLQVADKHSYLLGDLALAFETIKKEADEQGKNIVDHLGHLLIHGFLHLYGYDHMTDDDAKEMEELEIQICEELGIKNPYLKDYFVA